jgi:hypothetical protein
MLDNTRTIALIVLIVLLGILAYQHFMSKTEEGFFAPARGKRPAPAKGKGKKDDNKICKQVSPKKGFLSGILRRNNKGTPLGIRVPIEVQKIVQKYLDPMYTNMYSEACTYMQDDEIKRFAKKFADFLTSSDSGKGSCGSLFKIKGNEFICPTKNEIANIVMCQTKDEIGESFYSGPSPAQAPPPPWTFAGPGSPAQAPPPSEMQIPGKDVEDSKTSFDDIITKRKDYYRPNPMMQKYMRSLLTDALVYATKQVCKGVKKGKPISKDDIVKNTVAYLKTVKSFFCSYGKIECK